MNFIFCELIGVCFGDPQLLKTPEHDGLKFSLPLLCRDKTFVKGCVLLCVFVEHSGLDGSSQEVVGSSNRMNITSQMEIELIHWNDLTVATPSSSTFNTKGWSLTWLTDIRKSDAIEMPPNSLGNTHCSSGLAFTKRSWCDPSNNDISAITAMLKTLEKAQIHLTF